MDDCKVIIFPIAIDSQFYQVEAFREEFSAPVVAVALTQEIEDMLGQTKIGIPDRIYSLPKYYNEHKGYLKNNSINELLRIISEFERKYNISSISKHYYCDRNFLNEKKYITVVLRLAIYCKFVDYIVENENILFVKSNLTTAFGLILNEVAVNKGIAAIKHQSARVHGRIEFIDEVHMGALRGWKYVFDDISANGLDKYDKNVIKEALLWRDDFFTKPVRPKYSDFNSVLFFDAKKALKNIWLAVRVRFTKQYWKIILKYKIDRELNFRAPPGEDFIKDFLVREVKALFLRRTKYFKSTPALNVPFIYFPLQFVPEITTTTYAVPNDNQLSVIEALAKSIPGNMQVYVKEHTSMIGRRSFSFYKKLNRMFNVKIVSPKVNTFDLIKNCKIIATLNGTTGWEGFILGKPVIAFGEAFYREFPNILRLDIGCDMSKEIKKYLAEFSSSVADINNAIIAYFIVTGKMTSGDIGIDTRKEDAMENARKLANAFRCQLEQYPIRSNIMD